jgi:beta-lactamase superfamily II metal-dependent hydrolase
LEPDGPNPEDLAWLPVALTIHLVRQLAELPGSNLSVGQPAPVLVAAFYVVILAVTASAPRLAAAAPSRSGKAKPTGRLRRAMPAVLLSLLDVGAGDALLIETPDGRFVLIDGGPSQIALAENLGQLLPLTARQPDWVVVGGGRREQHDGLLAIPKRIPVGGVLLARNPQSDSLQTFVRQMKEAGRPVAVGTAGSHLDLGPGTELEILAMARFSACTTTPSACSSR